MHTKVDFRLRKEVDADLIRATSHLCKKDINQLCRDGLRLMLGIRTTRTSIITERPIHPVGSNTTVTVAGKPAVFIPAKKG